MSCHCLPCNRYFMSGEALQQHLQDSPAHRPSYDCNECDRSFSSEEALQKHFRDSSAHNSLYSCHDCDRDFRSEGALNQHFLDSPAHNHSHSCDDCNRFFNSEGALQQHLQNSQLHAAAWFCETCNRSFSTEQALEQHCQNSRTHQTIIETPLDAFFRSFPTFDYNPSLPPATSYARLREHKGWRHRNAESNDAWDLYQDALQGELRMWYGSEDDLTAWHALCRAIGVDPLPKTCDNCVEVSRISCKVHSSHTNVCYRSSEGHTSIL